MKKKLGAKGWLTGFFICVLALVLLMMGLMYIVDPFFQFRVRDNVYILNPRYVNSGLIKNHNYDSIIIGSSVTQNFDMDIFRQELGTEPLHVSMGGISAEEMAELTELARSTGKAEKYYLGIDLQCFSVSGQPSNNPDYLFSPGPLSTARYLLSYEAWFRFLPVDMGFAALKAAGIALPEKFRQSTSIDMLANWEADFVYDEDNVIDNYNIGAYAVSQVDTAGLRERLEENFDLIFQAVSGMEQDVVFFFPPYSCLYWLTADRGGYMDTYLDTKADFIARAEALGCTIFDFQHAPLCMDLNNYRDSTHYSGDINDYMTCCFADGEYMVSAADCDANRLALRENLDSFLARFGDRLTG